jgi:Cu+-exporting ATPase
LKSDKKLPGVQESNVNLATGKLNISFDENEISTQDIQAAVEKAGYKLQRTPSRKPLLSRA